ncbi:MAG: CPBP family intramembrane metalloprotease [Anaerolineales bacterium]|nr:CPBP family intramembrane metalloprotease [Anaerolineales bacterium]
MNADQVIVIAYSVIFIAAVALAIVRRKTFPLAESVMVVVIVGGVFTGLVYLATLPVKAVAITTRPSTAELAFTLAYLCFMAFLLVVKPAPKNLPGQFLKEKIAAISFKLLFFVLIPLACLRLFWHVSWADLGFTGGDVPGQFFAAALLILVFGGFNYVAGSAARPMREGQFSGRQVGLGLAVAFVWNVLEVGLVEEFFFRGFVQTRLVNALGSPLAGICLTSLLFGLAHAPGIYLRRADKVGPLGEKPSLLNALLYAIMVLSPTGWFTGLLYWRTQSLLAPIVVHAAIDAVAHAVEFIEGLRIRK